MKVIISAVVVAFGLMACNHEVPSGSQVQATDSEKEKVEDKTANEVLASYILDNKEAISAAIKKKFDKTMTISDVESCMAREARFNGGVPKPGQTMTTENSDPIIAGWQSGIVGTCHVETSDCQSGCELWAAITIGLPDGDFLPNAEASLKAAGFLDSNE